MDVKRALWTSALLWIFIFFEVSILMFGFKLSSGATYYTIHFILLAILTAICAYLYFKGKGIKRSSVEGLYLGISFVIVGVILDLIITVPLFVKDYGAFFSNALMLGFLETILVTIIYGSIKK